MNVSFKSYRDGLRSNGSLSHKAKESQSPNSKTLLPAEHPVIADLAVLSETRTLNAVLIIKHGSRQLYQVCHTSACLPM